MIQVKGYNNGLIKFYCTKCKLDGEQDVQELLADNCVLDVEVVCPQCKDMRVLYILECDDEIYSKSLIAELLNLKEKRRKED